MAKAPKTFESRKSLMLNVLQGLCRERVEGSGAIIPAGTVAEDARAGG